MKKFIALMLVLALGLSLCACSNMTKHPPTKNPLYHTLSEKMGMDFTEQDVHEYQSGEGYLIVYMNTDQRFDENSCVELGNGTTLQYPMTYGELCDAGWTLAEGELSDPFPMEEATEWFPMINSDGKTIEARIYNSAESPMALQDVPVLQLLFGDKGTETFAVSGIQRGATVQEILDTFGTPCVCSFHEEDDGSKSFAIIYMDESGDFDLYFDMDPETGLLENLVYSWN